MTHLYSVHLHRYCGACTDSSLVTALAEEGHVLLVALGLGLYVSAEMALRLLPSVLSAPQLLPWPCRGGGSGTDPQACAHKQTHIITMSPGSPTCLSLVSPGRTSPTIIIMASLGSQPSLPRVSPSHALDPQLGSMFLHPGFCHALHDDKLGFTSHFLRMEKPVDYLQPLTVIWFKQRL